MGKFCAIATCNMFDQRYFTAGRQLRGLPDCWVSEDGEAPGAAEVEAALLQVRGSLQLWNRPHVAQVQLGVGAVEGAEEAGLLRLGGGEVVVDPDSPARVHNGGPVEQLLHCKTLSHITVASLVRAGLLGVIGGVCA